MLNTTVNLEDELKEQKSVNSKVHAKELLVMEQYETIASEPDVESLFRKVGLGPALDAGKKAKEVNEKVSKFNKDKVYHIDDIKAIAERYYLRFLPSSYYQGKIDSELAGKVSAFRIAYGIDKVETPVPTKKEEGEIIEVGGVRIQSMYFIPTGNYGSWSIDSSGGSEKYFILAPKESFKLEERPKDPLFFYQIDDSHYYLVHKWGNDLSLSRAMLPVLASKIFFANSLLFAMMILAFVVKETSEGNFWTKCLPFSFGIVVIAYAIDAICSPIVAGRRRWLEENDWNSAYFK